MTTTENITPLNQVLADIELGMRAYERKVSTVHNASDGLQAEAASYQQGTPLFGDKVPTTLYKTEKPEHVLMCYMMAGGKTQKEIAAATGYTPAAVSQITRQPWFRKRFLALAAEAGQDQVEAFVKGETINSLETLILVRDNATSKGSERIAAANSILDRALGKPAVYIKSDSNLNIANAANTKDEIDRQLAAVQEQLRARGINPTGPNGAN